MSEFSSLSSSLKHTQAGLPSFAARGVIIIITMLVIVTLALGFIGKVDVIAVAQGKLIPFSRIKIVQPAQGGIITEILVNEGEYVEQGHILFRMSEVEAAADLESVKADIDNSTLQLRRIDSELSGRSFTNDRKDSPSILFNQVAEQYNANVSLYERNMAELQARVERASQELRMAEETKDKLQKLRPHLVEEESAYRELEKEGYVEKFSYSQRQRAKLELDADLSVQDHRVKFAQAQIDETTQSIARLKADYKKSLLDERIRIGAELNKLLQILVKQDFRNKLLELKAPQAGYVKDIATFTPGAVVSPGTILTTIVPRDETMRAEVWVSNGDVGFVRPKQDVKVKIESYPFQKYGLAGGVVTSVGADVSVPSQDQAESMPSKNYGYRALVDLDKSYLPYLTERLQLSPGMNVSVEINLGQRSIIEYVFSPILSAFHDAARER